MSIEMLTISVDALAAIADAYDINALDDGARKFWGANDEHVNTTAPADIELYAGRGGATLLTLADCITAREALATGTVDALLAAVQPLLNIANAWDANALDDEARKFYGDNLQHRTLTNPRDIVLVSGRGGATLLTLADALEARGNHHEVKHGKAA